MKHVYLVIVNWNGSSDTIQCLDTVKTLRRPGIQLSTVVVDNGSTNDSVRDISRAHPWVTMLALEENMGFSGGNNAGIRYGLSRGAEYIWLLNNDTLVHPGALSLIRALGEPKAGIAGSKIYFAPGREYHVSRYAKKDLGRVLWYAGGLVDWHNMYASHRGVDEVDTGQYDKSGRTEFVTGCSMMVRRKVFETVGLLDDRFFLYLEDLDFCLRAKANGFSSIYFPESRVWHVNAGSSGGAGRPIHDYYFTRNRLLIGMRYAPLRTKLALVRESVRLMHDGNPEKRRAITDALFGRWGKQYEQDSYT